MKITLVGLLILLAFSAVSQDFEESGVDSVRNIYWNTQVRTVDFDGVPNNYERFEYTPDSDMIVVIRCGDSIPYMHLNYVVPPSCLYWQKTNDSTVFAVSTSLVTGETEQLDSIQLTDHECVNDYYTRNHQNFHIDTIYLGKKVKLPSFDQEAYFLLNQASYYYQEKEGYEYGYYKLSELKGVCVTKNFRIKYVGKWKNGKKHGKWKELDKTGRIVTIKKYKEGELTRSKSFDR